MAKSKSKNPQTPPDIDSLKSELASFASSLGFSSSSNASGFNDTDFRPPKNPDKKPNHRTNINKTQNSNEPKNENVSDTKADKKKVRPKKPAPSVNSVNLDNNHFPKGNFKNFPKVPLIKASSLGIWYEEAKELEDKVIGEGRKSNMGVEEWKVYVEKKKEVAQKLLNQYTMEYEVSEGRKGDVKMLVATQRSGTAADKVSAYSVLVGENPIANLRSLDALLALVTSKVGKRHAFTGFDALKELFISRLLPERKLKRLFQQPLNLLPETKDGNSLLLFWYWEDCLKQRYERFVFSLEEASRDSLPMLKDKALKMIYSLLRSKSELERRLLTALVNKLGDPQTKGASNADFHLTNILSDHPNMKTVVIDEVDSFLFRPRLGLRAKYHAVNFLSQIRLSQRADGPKVAKRLIDVYFALFKVLISEATTGEKLEKGKKPEYKKSTSRKDETKSSPESHVEMDSRILSALLTGVNRAFPFVASSEADDIIETQTPVLFQLVHSKNFNVGVQALMLLDKISSRNQIVSDRFYRALYTKLLLPAAINTSKAELFIGLLLRAIKNDINLKRVCAFSKRVLQVALQQPPQYACGCLFLLSEVLKAKPPLWSMVLQTESANEDDEHFEDIVEETENEPQTEECSNDDHAEDECMKDISPKNLQESRIPEDLDSSGSQPIENKLFTLPQGYNPRHREPSFCNADRVSWWELTVLASHVHPSVATMASTLLSGANIVYNGNPINDLSLTAFLDKFMEKKPKQSTWHGGSQIEPAKQLEMNNHLIGPEILSLAEVDVPPEDFVFHKFYMNKMSSIKKIKKKKRKSQQDEAAEDLFGVDGDDESDNEEIENMLDSADITSERDGEYEYDDLDQVANEDDNDLVGDVSDAELDIPSDMSEGEDFDSLVMEDAGDGTGDMENGSNDDTDIGVGDMDDGSDDNAEVGIGDMDDGSADEGRTKQRKRKRKFDRKTNASPFVSIDEYKHLLNEDGPASTEAILSKRMKNKPRKKSRPQKKRKSSS